MNIKWDNIFHLLFRIMLSLFLCLCGITLYLGAFQDKEHLYALGLAILSCLIFYVFMPQIARWLNGLGASRSWLLLTLFCFMIKLAWVLYVKVPIDGDYMVFWNVANDLAQNREIHNRYVALFPHIFGYSSFLSVFLSNLGFVPLLPQVLNIVLTLCSGTELFFLCRKWCSPEAGAAVYLLWALCPSQTIYNSLILSEPLYTTLLLTFFLIVTYVGDFEAGKRRPSFIGAVAGCLCGLLLRGIQILRPIAAVPLIALVLWLVLLSAELWNPLKRRMWLPLLALTVGVYSFTGPLWQTYMTERLGEVPSSTPGYSIFVGFNTSSGGRWNQEDSERLYDYNSLPDITAEEVQRTLLKDARDRITHERQAIPGLMVQKLRIFLGSDHACVGYSQVVLRHTTLFSCLCNGFYYAMLLLAGLGVIRLWKSGANSAILLAPLYFLGLTLAQLLVEVAGRYHYSIIPMLTILAAASLPYRAGMRNISCGSDHD